MRFLAQSRVQNGAQMIGLAIFQSASPPRILYLRFACSQFL
jgi:hypothetical protein